MERLPDHSDENGINVEVPLHGADTTDFLNRIHLIVGDSSQQLLLYSAASILQDVSDKQLSVEEAQIAIAKLEQKEGGSILSPESTFKDGIEEEDRPILLALRERIENDRRRKEIDGGHRQNIRHRKKSTFKRRRHR